MCKVLFGVLFLCLPVGSNLNVTETTILNSNPDFTAAHAAIQRSSVVSVDEDEDDAQLGVGFEV